MVEPKAINLAKFFSGEPAQSSSATGAEQKTSIPTDSASIPKSALSEILETIKETTETNTIQEKIIVNEKRDDAILQGMVGSLQQRFYFLESAFLNLTSKFNTELQTRKREVEKQERLLLSQYAEATKISDSDLKSLTGVNRQTDSGEDSTFGLSEQASTGEESEGGVANLAMLGALGLGAAAAAAFDVPYSTEGSGSTASAGVWKPLLDLIGSGEGPGGYESMYPSTTLKGATRMTIAEVANKATGAVGRYQNMPEYLINRATGAGLNPQVDLYSPENQDKIAVYTIEQEAGGKDWLSGNYPGGDEAFADRLANIWAALKGKDGVGKYDGYGGNKATIDFDRTLKSLQEVKQNQYSAPELGKQSSITTSPQSVNTAFGIQQKYSPTEVGQNVNPIVLPMGGSPQMAAKTQISSGSAVPAGVSRNFNNPYPEIVQAHFNIIV